MFFLKANITRFTSVLIILFMTSSLDGMAQETDFGDYPQEIKEYLSHLFKDNQFQYTYQVDSPEEFSAYQTKARSILLKLVCLNKINAQSGTFQPQVQLGDITDLDGYTRQQAWIETEPDVKIFFWLLIPKSDGPHPLGIFPHGHDSRGYDTSAGVYHDEAHRQKSLKQDRDVAVQAVKRGFIAIAPATRGLADGGLPDPKKRHGERGCRAQLMHCLLAGRTAIGERVWDMMRIIDWAETLPDVDTSTILMMGNSGGGVVTLYAAACDERISIAVPSCSFSSFTSPNGYIYHCDCNMVPGILELGDMPDVAGLIAPRHLLTVSGVKDGLHSVKDINRAADRVKALFSAAGCPDHYEHRWGQEGHRFYKSLMWNFIMPIIK